jgi:hypothetical protein
MAGFEGMPPVGQTRRLLARVGLYDIDVQVFFGAANPSPAVLAAAREELGRLVVPACPDAQPVSPDELPAAKAYCCAVAGPLPGRPRPIS